MNAKIQTEADIDKAIDVCADYANTVVLDSLVSAEGFIATQYGSEGTDLFYATMITALRVCVMRGWDKQTLMRDVEHHIDDQLED